MPTFVLTICTVIWGFTFVVVKDALDASDAFTFLTLRFGLGALACLGWARRGVLVPDTLKRGVFLGVVLFLGYAAQTFGLAETTPSRSAFLTGLAVIMVPFVSWWTVRRAPAPASVVGALIAVYGMGQLTGFGLDGFTRGDALTIGCAIAYAFHISLTERFASNGASAALVAVQLAVVAVLSAACIPFGHFHFEPTNAYWFTVVTTGLIASGFAISVQTWAQAKTPAVQAAVIFSLEPVVALLTSLALGRETAHEAEVIGGACIVAGVLVSEVGATVARRALAIARLS